MKSFVSPQKLGFQFSFADWLNWSIYFCSSSWTMSVDDSSFFIPNKIICSTLIYTSGVPKTRPKVMERVWFFESAKVVGTQNPVESSASFSIHSVDKTFTFVAKHKIFITRKRVKNQHKLWIFQLPFMQQTWSLAAN